MVRTPDRRMTLSQQVAQLEARAGKLHQRVAELERERDQACERIEELEHLLGLKDIGHPALSLPRVQQKLLKLLMRYEVLPNEIAATAMGRDTSVKALDVHYQFMRKKLPTGVQIKTHRGIGRYIPREQKALLKIDTGKREVWLV